MDTKTLPSNLRPGAEKVEKDITEFVSALFRCFHETSLVQTEHGEFQVFGDGALIGRGPTSYHAWRNAAVNLET